MDDEVMHAAITDAWRRLVPSVSWRGIPTGWNAMDAWTLGEVVQAVRPTVILVAGGIGRGGLSLFVGDCLDILMHGRVVAGEQMAPERRASLPKHRRVLWVPNDLLVEDFRTAERLTNHSCPVLVVASPSEGCGTRDVAGLVTIGSYLVASGGGVFHHWPEGFQPDPSCDEMGLSACTWLRREA